MPSRARLRARVASPMATLAEVFGVKVDDSQADLPENWKRCWCPFTNRRCDVTANRGDRASLSLLAPQVSEGDAAAIRAAYGNDPIPLGICTIATQRRYQNSSSPWVVCPKRVLEL